jgi:arginase
MLSPSLCRNPKVALILLPYDSGQFNARMGCGPAGLTERGLADELRKCCEVESIEIRLPHGFYTEASALVELQGRASTAAQQAISRGARPIILSGNCGVAALTATAALGPERTAVVWFDAHADFNTPETSASGFLDGMGMAILAGRCYQKIAERLEGFKPLPCEHIIQVGVRHPDPEEQLLLRSTRVTRIATQELGRLREALELVTRETSEIYVHLDTDVLDISEGRANTYACAGGLTRRQLYQAVEEIRSIGKIGAVSITSYDPAADLDGSIAQAVIGLSPLLVS